MHLRWALALLLLLLSGCATMHPMAFDHASKGVDVSSQSIVLMTADVFRTDDSRYVLRPMVVFWRALDAGANEAMPRFRTNQETDLVAAAEGRHELALRMALQPGRYELIDINGLASAFPFIGNFSVPLFLELTVPPHSVTYVGHVSAQLRPRQDGEFRAGAVIPLVDQGVTGMAGGTFDVKVEDASATDLTMFRSTFPALGDTPIATAILPPFDRAKVQRRLGGKDDNVPSGGAATSH